MPAGKKDFSSIQGNINVSSGRNIGFSGNPFYSMMDQWKCRELKALFNGPHGKKNGMI